MAASVALCGIREKRPGYPSRRSGQKVPLPSSGQAGTAFKPQTGSLSLTGARVEGPFESARTEGSVAARRGSRRFVRRRPPGRSVVLVILVLILRRLGLLLLLTVLVLVGRRIRLRPSRRRLRSSARTILGVVRASRVAVFVRSSFIARRLIVRRRMERGPHVVIRLRGVRLIPIHRRIAVLVAVFIRVRIAARRREGTIAGPRSVVVVAGPSVVVFIVRPRCVCPCGIAVSVVAVRRMEWLESWTRIVVLIVWVRRVVRSCVSIRGVLVEARPPIIIFVARTIARLIVGLAAVRPELRIARRTAARERLRVADGNSVRCGRQFRYDAAIRQGSRRYGPRICLTAECAALRRLYCCAVHHAGILDVALRNAHAGPSDRPAVDERVAIDGGDGANIICVRVVVNHCR